MSTVQCTNRKTFNRLRRTNHTHLREPQSHMTRNSKVIVFAALAACLVGAAQAQWVCSDTCVNSMGLQTIVSFDWNFIFYIMLGVCLSLRSAAFFFFWFLFLDM